MNQTLAQFNFEKRLADERKRNKEMRSKQERIDFFPFISGEVLEQNRQRINAQLKGEFQQYMTSRANQATPLRTQDDLRSTSKKEGLRNSQFFASASNRLTKPSQGYVKELFDSCYKRPD